MYRADRYKLLID